MAGNDCHTSRQVFVDLNDEFIDGTVLSQAEIAFKNIFATLKKAGFEKNDIVYIDPAFPYLKDLEIITPYYDSLLKKIKAGKNNLSSCGLKNRFDITINRFFKFKISKYTYINLTVFPSINKVNQKRDLHK